MELGTFRHSQIPRCGFSGGVEMCTAGTSQQAGRFPPPVTPLTSRPTALARRELNHVLVLPRPHPQRLTTFTTARVIASGEWVVSGNTALGLTLRIPNWHPLRVRRRCGSYWPWCRRSPYVQGPAWVAAKLASLECFPVLERKVAVESPALTTSTKVPLCLMWFLCGVQRPHGHFVDVTYCQLWPRWSTRCPGFYELGSSGRPHGLLVMNVASRARLPAFEPSFATY